MLLVSLLEIISIGAVIPFVAVLVDPSKLLSDPYLSGILITLNIEDHEELRYFITLIFSIIIVLSSITRLSLLLMQSRVGYAIGADLGYKIYSAVLSRSYEDHIVHNSSETISAITKKTNSCVSSTIIPLMNVIASSITCVLIVLVLIFVDPKKTLLILGVFGFLYLIVWVTIRRKIQENSANIALKHDVIVKNVVEGLNSFRNIIIENNAKLYLGVFRESDVSLRRSLASNQFSSESPKYLMEALGMILISWFAYLSIKRGAEFQDFLPSIGVLVLGAQRILPVLQKGYSGWTQMRGEAASLRDVVEILNECDESKEHLRAERGRLKLEKELILSNVGFRYQGAENDSLHCVSLTVSKGDIIGITGKSGSGKSTLMDILLGLLEPTTGEIYVDQKKVTLTNNPAWFENIAHVPQKVFLADSSIAENVAFGQELNSIENSKLLKALEVSQLHNFIVDKNNVQGSKLGENGVNISGGQAQRIGIARANYRDKPILLLDEATSALDKETQKKIISNLVHSGKTVIMITHDPENLKYCNKVFRVSDGIVISEPTNDK